MNDQRTLRRRLSDLAADYDPESLDELREAYEHVPEHLLRLLDALDQTRSVEGRDAVLRDLAGDSAAAQGAEFQLGYMCRHGDELREVSVPTVHRAADGHLYAREAADAVLDDGRAVELKSYDFSSRYYRDRAGETARRVVDQARDRLEQGYAEVDVVFDTSRGDVPDELREALDASLDDEARRRIHVKTE
ncbi:MAG: hypothetical protein Q8S73_20375 [Deltaproteobacteria bacterium]|nr:hypothetical protein [Myxococcales bacterium]MDP3216476.1 hypothetical protein [Deltaproteobacteria bacterium]